MWCLGVVLFSRVREHKLQEEDFLFKVENANLGIQQAKDFDQNHWTVKIVNTLQVEFWTKGHIYVEAIFTAVF